MASLLCVFIVFAETLGINYLQPVRTNGETRVLPSIFNFARKKGGDWNSVKAKSTIRIQYLTAGGAAVLTSAADESSLNGR